MEVLRMVNSGTEAVMSAIRVARGFTKRDMILKFKGCYHGHSDGLLVKAGSAALTAAVPDSLGVPKSYTENTLVALYNDEKSVEELFEKYGNKIACVVVEPVAANMGVVLPKKGFLQFLRDITEKYGSLLIFDEVITGFRLSLGGAQEYFGIKPDMTTLGKIVGVVCLWLSMVVEKNYGLCCSFRWSISGWYSFRQSYCYNSRYCYSYSFKGK